MGTRPLRLLIRGRIPSPDLPADTSLWPKEWSVIHYKDYPRFEKIPLPETHPRADFFKLIEKRRSERDFTGKSIELRALSTLLRYSCGIRSGATERRSRAQPSGGGRFPIEVYPVVFKGSDELRSGLYHYNVKEHALDVLWQRPFTKADISGLFTYDWAQNASLAIIMTAVFGRNQMKYGERGYRYILLEAGHIGQNIYLNAEALGLKCCALGGTRDVNLEKLIDVDGITEAIVYGLVLG